ncbi:MAG: LamG-like jellyroll fold domain-containing protein [bacterium]
MNIFRKIFGCTILLFAVFSIDTRGQQVSIPLIDVMPDALSPYSMRDWKKVAAGYDSLVFNYNATGEYLPLNFFDNNTVNYPDQSFGLHSFVGTTSPDNGEAINVLPAVVGASLNGIDKSNQNGYDWVKMCREYFNNRPEENVYLNNPSATSGDDWWYATMPNIFFYQLYDLYPETNDFDYQFNMVADRWLEAVELMGGSTTPWNVPEMNYRGWYLSTMEPYQGGVIEPEAAGALGWIFYNAYLETGDENYRTGAEWCIEFLNSLSTNPAYEVQLPYGAYIAARMNAELGTEYDIEKIVNWCFSMAPLRQWNVITGRWGIYDVNGIIGEDSDRKYAFLMNTFQQIGALVPLVRYNERFANAIGKWVLNAANSCRLFYSKYLEDLRQDSETWSQIYDPESYIGYEALLQGGSGWPFATGDAKEGGWAATNLSLYSSSSVGYLAAIVDTTNIPTILKLDLNKTDFFQHNSYQSYLIYNPYENEQTVEINLPSGVFDIYNSISNSFLANNVSHIYNLQLAAKSSAVLVLVPSGGTVEQKLNRLFVNGIAVDYELNSQVTNYPPRIKSLSAEKDSMRIGTTTKIYCTAVDRDNNALSYGWSANAGNISGTDSVIDFEAPGTAGEAIIQVIVNDGNGAADTSRINLNIVESINHAPQINKIKATPRKIDLGSNTQIKCYASDEDADALFYQWLFDDVPAAGMNDSVGWTAPEQEGDYYIKCIVDDGNGGMDTDSLWLMVRDFSQHVSGNLIAFYPFNGNANDESGNSHNGISNGVTYVSDRFQNQNKAVYFDGGSDNVTIPNAASLNFQDGIAICFWMKTNNLSTKEEYIISHGSWENRYKISISNNKLRWTIKTDKNVNNGVVDLDSETNLKSNTQYFCAAMYDGSDMELWINNELDAFGSWSGKLLTANYDVTISQMKPGDSNYNFKGTLDDIRIHDYALSIDELNVLYDFILPVEQVNELIPIQAKLYPNYPNPFNGQTEIQYELAKQSRVEIYVYDVLGRRIKKLIDQENLPGNYKTVWDGKNDLGIEVSSGIYFCLMKTIEGISKNKMLLLK